jgi:hypothetical protein
MLIKRRNERLGWRSQRNLNLSFVDTCLNRSSLMHRYFSYLFLGITTLVFFPHKTGVCQDSNTKDNQESSSKLYALPKRVAAMSFPSKPKTKVNSVTIPALGDIVTSEMVVIDSERTSVYQLVVVKYPDPSKFDTTKAMDAIVKKASQRGKVLSKNEFTKQGMKSGVEMIVETEDKFLFRTRIFIDPSGPHAYTCQLIGSPDFVKSKAADSFLNSFSATPDTDVTVVEPDK